MNITFNKYNTYYLSFSFFVCVVSDKVSAVAPMNPGATVDEVQNKYAIQDQVISQVVVVLLLMLFLKKIRLLKLSIHWWRSMAMRQWHD